MKSRTTKKFRELLAQLPDQVRAAAKESYGVFRDDPSHPGLRFKKVHPKDPIYSVRVGAGYRAVGLLKEDAVVWFWIGTHAEYDTLLESL